MKFEGKVAIVTGGAAGIGKSICSAFLELGMKVCICDINEEAARIFIEDNEETYKNKSVFIKCDVSSENEFRGAFDKVIEMYGKIDIVINNAGIFNEKEWRKVIDVDFIGVINGLHLAFEYMDKNNGGYVINVASNAGVEPFPLGPVYAGCKHGVIGLTKSYGTDYHLQKSRVVISAICPGPVDTELLHLFPKYAHDEEMAKLHMQKIQYISPQDVANAVIKLLNDEKNGAVMRIDGEGARYV